jgi:hypothetical protein
MKAPKPAAYHMLNQRLAITQYKIAFWPSVISCKNLSSVLTFLPGLPGVQRASAPPKITCSWIALPTFLQFPNH